MRFQIAVLGATGYIGTPYREEIRAAADDASIVALAARRQQRLEAARQLDGAQLATQDWHEAVEHPDVNCVLVATPDALHHREVLRCAELGHHVICEKPVGLNAQQAAEMLRSLQEAGVAHFVPFWTRYVPVFARAREIVEAGELGEVKAVIYRWHNPRPESMPFTWRDDAEVSAAGSIADVGSHAYDTVRWILGDEASQVLAHADVISPAKPDLGEIDLTEALEWGQSHHRADAPATKRGTAFDYANVIWKFQKGAVGSLVLSHAPLLRKGLAPELELHGTTASLGIDRIQSQLMLARTTTGAETLEVVEDPGFGNRFAKHVFPALREQIEGGTTAHPTVEDGWQVQRFTDAAVQSAKQGGWIDLPS